MKAYLLILSLPIALISITSCSQTPADAAVDAATSNMGPVKSAAVRNATGHGTGPVEKAQDNASDKIDDLKKD